MKLERADEMKSFLSESLKAMIQKRVTLVIEHYKKKEEALCNMISDILIELANSRHGYLVISYLRSSIVIERHEFYLAFYTDEPYIEEEPDEVIVRLDELFEDIDDDFAEVEKMLRKKFIRILSCELEDIRRYYVLQVYIKCEKLFQQILENIRGKEGIKVYYGEYMGAMPVEIGMV